MAKGEGKGSGIIGCLFCVSLIFGILVSVVALIGLFVAIWHTWDLLYGNDELLSLANLAVDDERLEDAYYVFIAFTLIAQFLSCVGGRNKQSDEGKGSQQSSCAGTAFSLALIAGHMASGILGVLYKDEAIPLVRTGMESLIPNASYMNPEGGAVTPEYTKMGEYFNYLQVKYECCGVVETNAKEYFDAYFEDRYKMKFPYACCVLKDKKNSSWRQVNHEDVEDPTRCSNFERNYFHKNTCYRYERDWLTDKSNFIIGYNFALLVLNIGSFGLLVFAMCCG
ncbi:hypothetical protein CAPTEDRAFT_584 [Capitella teleta]|uniref:Tetraspanin n=1 Tax=Capitella teleta TaxID=283909 RepID=R7T8Z0_CAPTE|nr:hypothetical protein CAPTEDRAFT_584 [Capitella teleta]|eukprot:ELT89893.1 hypothetical protein CAPTEDRAFT_584 [Capitella teleta]